MAKLAGYYNVDDFNNYKRKQGKCLPPNLNVLAAACHIQDLFDAKKLTFGFMGGLSMLCLGYRREMPDLHVAYDDRDFDRLKSKLENDRRVRLPTGMNSLLPCKVLVWTGPEYKDQGCSVNASIELDLVPSSACGTPQAGGLTRELVLLRLKTASGRHMVFKSLNTQYLLATLLSYCKARDLLWDPRKDILYLCKNETVEVQRIRAKLNIKEVKEMFLGTSFFSRLNVQDQRLCYRTLLDTEPPPTMAITPPPPQPQVSARPKQRRPEQVTDDRVPRSRYRNASGQRRDIDSTTAHGVARDEKPKSECHLQSPRHATNIQGMQCVNSAKPHTVSAAAAARQARRSMPNLLVPQTVVLTSSGRPSAQQYLQNPGPSCAQPPPSVRHEGFGTSGLEYGGSFQPAHMRVTSDESDKGQAFSPGQRTTAGRTDSTRTDSTGTPAKGIQSQKGSIHVVSPEGEDVLRQQYFDDDSSTARGKLRLVSPEGLYATSEGSIQHTQTQSRHQRHSSAPPAQTEQTLVFELDATEIAQPAVTAELPAELVVSESTEQYGTYQVAPLQQLKRRTISTPFEASRLPSSLIAGGMAVHSYHRSLTSNEQSNELASGFSTRQTNAYRYTSYAAPQSKVTHANTYHTSPEEQNEPIYRAYRPFVVTNQLDRTDSVSSVYSPAHKRHVSHDSTASHDSDKLAKDYQDLLNFEDGYGSN